LRAGWRGAGRAACPRQGARLDAARERQAAVEAYEDSFYWGLQGINDGIRDHAANPGIDNAPEWFEALQAAI
jgi:hypothetical protein